MADLLSNSTVLMSGQICNVMHMINLLPVSYRKGKNPNDRNKTHGCVLLDPKQSVFTVTKCVLLLSYQIDSPTLILIN